MSPTESAHVFGYYSISHGATAFARVPTELTRKLGRYDVPVFRLGRLAVDSSVQGQGLGGELLLAAGERALAVAAEVGGTALAIEAKDEIASPVQLIGSTSVGGGGVKAGGIAEMLSI